MGFNSGFKGLNVVSVLWSFSPPTTTIGGRYELCCLALSCPVPVLLSGWPDLVQIKVLDHRFEVGLEVWLWYVYRVYLKCLDKLQERVPYIKTSKEVIWMYVRSFRGITPTLAWPEDFFLCVGKMKNHSVFFYNWKWSDISPTYLRYFSDHLQPSRDLRKGAAVHDQTCPCVNWFRWRIFWVFVFEM